MAKLIVADFLGHTESNGHRGFVCRERPLEGRPRQDGTSVRFLFPFFLSRSNLVSGQAWHLPECYFRIGPRAKGFTLGLDLEHPCGPPQVALNASSSRGIDCPHAHQKKAACTGSFSLTAFGISSALAVTGNGSRRVGLCSKWAKIGENRTIARLSHESAMQMSRLLHGCVVSTP